MVVNPLQVATMAEAAITPGHALTFVFERNGGRSKGGLQQTPLGAGSRALRKAFGSKPSEAVPRSCRFLLPGEDCRPANVLIPNWTGGK